ncbi:alpha/beta-hydrolase [Jaminaea rosea]|uniref:Alpha/beta-hydrolase n=1 Tax=Jaminaea rosea TaxID=1569628 RepID=A0A316UH74_9BASI|nr:alpha/beta-hydrolase [Jaminaea rosea]PWN24612.1 alpha/beta-hydrolase [Jaminaea rosea]
MSLALRAAAPLRSLTPCRRLHTTHSLFNSSKASSDPFSIPPAPPTGQTVDLAFEHHAPPPSSSSTASTSCKSLVIAHGLFGSKQNWRSLSRSLASKLNLPVYAVDLRNHGTSPHIDSGMSYKDMAADLLRFIRSQNLSKVALVGHSMGGKAVMATALDESLKEGELESMVSVDMSPARGALSEQFEKYMEAMIDINKKGCNDRKHADEMLKETESDPSIRSFLLTNLHRPSNSPDKPWSFRVPVETIKEHLPQIGDFPYDVDGGRKWEGRTLFVKGSKSKYLNRKNIPIANTYFPNAQHVTLDAGHWVQAERPREFTDVLIRFLQGEQVGGGEMASL